MRRIKGTGVVQNTTKETSKKTSSRNDETPKPTEQMAKVQTVQVNEMGNKTDKWVDL